ncbi:MAG: hypothetical protein RSB09_03360, partial [Clostridia bacterium]
GDHYQVTLLVAGNEIVAHDTSDYAVDEEVGLYIKPFDLHIMHKTRIINEIDTTITGENKVEICGVDFECKTDLPSGTPVKISIDFDDVEIMDDENDGTISATVSTSIYKGSYYQCILMTDDHYNFFADTDDDWMKGDRVGIKIAPEKIIIEKREVVEGDESAAQSATYGGNDTAVNADSSKMLESAESAESVRAANDDAENIGVVFEDEAKKINDDSNAPSQNDVETNTDNNEAEGSKK